MLNTRTSQPAYSYSSRQGLRVAPKYRLNQIKLYAFHGLVHFSRVYQMMHRR